VKQPEQRGIRDQSSTEQTAMTSILQRLACVLMLAGPGGDTLAEPSIDRTRPKANIVLVISDDTTYHDFVCFGSPDAQTPNIDRLASQGMRLTHCFTGTAMCAPTRQQLYTGLFPVRSGAYPNHSCVRDDVRSMVHHLGDLGYRVGLCGKTHFGPKESFPFERIGGRQIGRFLSADDQARPRCLVYCTHHAHAPWTSGDASRYDPAAIRLPPYLVDTPEMRRAYQRYLAEISALDDQVGELVQQVDDTGRADDSIFIFTSEQGSAVPFAKWTCYDAGLRTATIIRWPKRIEPGSVSDALVQYVDVLPTLVEAAGGDPEAIDTGIDGAPDGGRGFDGRSFLDVLVGQSDRHREVVFGIQTTRGIISGSKCYPIRSVRDRRYKLIRNLNHEAAFKNLITRPNNPNHGYWESWLDLAEHDEHAASLVRRYQHRPAMELYDLKADPNEMRNLAADPAYAGRIAALNERLNAWMKQQGDKGIPTEMKAKHRQMR